MMRPNNQRMVILFISFFSMVIMAKAAEVTAEEGLPEENKIEYKSEDLRDPFAEEKIEIQEQPKEEAQVKPLPSLQIQGIVWGGSLPQAIINNEVMMVGDTVEGARITDINQSGVTVFFGNRQYNLTTSMPISSKDSKNIPQGSGKNP